MQPQAYISKYGIIIDYAMKEISKKHHTIGCCGIDCGLCPRFYTKGKSKCPGCGGLDFLEKHPACGILTCCVSKKGWEVCGQCMEYPCAKYAPEKINKDSFVTHQKIFENHSFIQQNGITTFIKQQKQRMEILQFFLQHFDNNRSKSFLCVSCTLLPLSKLKKIREKHSQNAEGLSVNERNQKLKECLLRHAKESGIELVLNVRK